MSKWLTRANGYSSQTSATTHLRFALVHRSWTPHVLKSLYRFPRLTSKESIEKFSRCLTHPLELWGTELLPDGTIGGAVGERSRYTRLITYCVGRGVSDQALQQPCYLADSAVHNLSLRSGIRRPTTSCGPGRGSPTRPGKLFV